jgi:hypothetical protein
VEVQSLVEKKSCFDITDSIENVTKDLLELQLKKLDSKKEKYD